MRKWIKTLGALAGGILFFFIMTSTVLAADEKTYTGSFQKETGKDLATVRYYSEDASVYRFADVTETDTEYVYSFTAQEADYTIVPEFFSTTKWDGAVDVSWYEPGQTDYDIETPAQLAGLAAIVNGSVDSKTPDYRIKGDHSLIENFFVENVTLVGSGGGNLSDDVYFGLSKNTFANKTIHLRSNLDMGGVLDENLVRPDTAGAGVNTEVDAWSGPNWTPIGGRYCMNADAIQNADAHLVIAYFYGVFDGHGHSITNLYCDRSNLSLDFGHSQGLGLIGSIAGEYEGQDAPVVTVNPAVRNVSVDGLIHGRRMVGGIVGQIGDEVPFISVENCANFAEVTGHDSKGCGGIVATGWANDGLIVNCYNTGYIHNSDYACPTGGILGNNDNMDVHNCYNIGTIYASGNRGRAIGGHDAGTYTVDHCYYLEGCDNNPESNGWYYTGTNVTANCVALSEADLKKLDFISYLNTNGEAFVFEQGATPKLSWEVGLTGTCALSYTQPNGGTIASVYGNQVDYGTVIYLTNEEDDGWAFRHYLCNGLTPSSDFYTITRDTEISGVFETMQAGVLKIEYEESCIITVVKDGTIMQDGKAVSVTDYPIESGDPLFENDILKVSLEWREGAYPTNPDLVYYGMTYPDSVTAWKVAYSYDGDRENAAFGTSKRHSVTSEISQEGVSLTLYVQPETTNKSWLDPGIPDTSWYVGHEGDSLYTISSARQLAGMLSLIRNGNDFAGKTIQIDRDISLANDDGTSGVRWWNIGSLTSKAFSGTFEGNGHMIYDMTSISESSGAGLFPYLKNATVQNLTISGVSAAKGAAGLAFIAEGSAVLGVNSFVEVTSDASTATGGLLGRIEGGSASTIANCINYGAVNGNDKVGGIVGSIESSAASSIQDSVNYGVISGSDGNGSSGGVGGITGRISGSSPSSLMRCANYGTVSGGSWYVGGVIGSAAGGTNRLITISDCYNSGEVSNGSGYASAAVGGLIGEFSYVNLSNSYNYGTVSATESFSSENLGAVIGNDRRRAGSTITNTYYLENSAPASGIVTVADHRNAEAKTAAEFADSSLLNTLNTNQCFAFLAGNAQYPEFGFVSGTEHVHAGGEANCHAKAICTSCKMPYGELDETNHDGDTNTINALIPIWVTDGYTGDLICESCHTILEAGTVISADRDRVILTIYEKTEYGEATQVKTYTLADIDRLSKECENGVYAYQYWRSGREVRTVSNGYVTLDAVLADAGLTFGEEDLLEPSGSSGVSKSVFEEKKYYFRSLEDYDEVPAVLSFKEQSGSNGESIDELADTATYLNTLHLLYGVAPEGYQNEGGFRLVQNTTSLTLIHPHTHVISEVAAKEATCDEDGYITHWQCELCNKAFTDESGLTERDASEVMLPATGHTLTKVEAKTASCEEDGNPEYWTCSVCGKYFADENAETEMAEGDTIIPGGHTEEIIPGKEATFTEAGLTDGAVCSVCGTVLKEQEEIPAYGIRIAGSNRYQTAMLSAEEYMKQTGVESLDTIIVAYGENFADALSGSYLSKVKDAPLILVSGKQEATVTAFINEKVAKGGTVYLLGGTGVVTQSFEDGLSGYNVKRLAGQNRYMTNLAILEEAGVSNEEILVCSGSAFPDALSASAVGKPILLVGKSLTEEQQVYLGALETSTYYLIGGTGAVNETVAGTIGSYGSTKRVYGMNRYATSLAIAEEFFVSEELSKVVMAYGENFPDGLSAGPLALAEHAPLILADSKDSHVAEIQTYIQSTGIAFYTILGGPTLISDQAVETMAGK